MNYRRAFPVFSIAFCVMYVLCFSFKWALFLYYPAVHEFHRTPHSSLGPAMSWYGWIANSILGSLGAAGLSLLLPARGSAKLWSVLSWVMPTAAALFLIVGVRSFFVR